MAARPSSPSPLKRPWYLVAALVGGWVYGAQAIGAGWEEIAFYRGETIDLHAATDSISDTATRDVAIAAGERWLSTKRDSQSRELPLGIATLLLGSAMMVLSVRSMTGREGARSALVQVVLVHAGLVVAGFFLTAAVMHAGAEFEARLKFSTQPGNVEPGFVDHASLLFARVGPPLQVAIEGVWSALIILALTRPRVRPFFYASPPGPLGEG